MTGLSGLAIAAPTAKGNPCPIEPPVKHNQSCGLALRAWGVTRKLDVAASSDTIEFSGIRLAIKRPRLLASKLPDSGTSEIGVWSRFLFILFAPASSAKLFNA